MTKKYYQILEINETATAEEIKKAYRKLALKWHPDKWGNKSLEERQNANDKMREVNQAFEVLGDEEIKKRYDLGETEFTTDFGGYDYEAEIKEETRRKEEELRRAKVERIDIELEILKLEMKSLDRSSTISEISATFSFTYPRVFKENLDSRLWEGYQDWMEKVVKTEITIPKGKERSEELREFKEEMIRAIKEAETNLENSEKSKKKGKVNDKVEREKTSAIKEIESLIVERGLKVEDLDENCFNYKEQINNLDKVWKIRELRDKIAELIYRHEVKNNNNKSDNPREEIDSRPMNEDKSRDQKAGNRPSNKSSDNDKTNNYNNLTREELIRKVNQKDLENSSLKEIIQALENKISELETEIAELKLEKPTLEVQQEIKKRESWLKESKQSLEKIRGFDTQSKENNPTSSNNNFPTGWVVGGISLLVVGGITTLLIIRSKKRKKLSH